jgi:hypothetical protein
MRRFLAFGVSGRPESGRSSRLPRHLRFRESLFRTSFLKPLLFGSAALPATQFFQSLRGIDAVAHRARLGRASGLTSWSPKTQSAKPQTQVTSFRAAGGCVASSTMMRSWACVSMTLVRSQFGQTKVIVRFLLFALRSRSNHTHRTFRADRSDFLRCRTALGIYSRIQGSTAFLRPVSAFFR